jgi:hypothetical protein
VIKKVEIYKKYCRSKFCSKIVQINNEADK